MHFKVFINQLENTLNDVYNSIYKIKHDFVWNQTITKPQKLFVYIETINYKLFIYESYFLVYKQNLRISKLKKYMFIK